MTTITGPVLKPDNVTIWTGLLITFHARPGDYGASSVLPAPLVKTRTDSSGAFSVDLPPGEYVVSYPEYSESYFEAQTAPETRFSITVPASGPVSLQVLRNQTLQQAGGYVTRAALAADVAAVLLRPTARPLTVIGLGTSITMGGADYQTAQGTNWKQGNTSYLTWMAHYSQQRLQLLRNAGVGGDWTYQMLARMDADVIAYKPDICVIEAAPNDVTNGVPLATIAANITAMHQKLQAAGITTVLLTGTPRASTYLAATRDVALWLERYAAANGLLLIDTYRVTADQATGEYKSGYSADTLHPTQLAAREMGKEVVRAILGSLPTVTLLPLATANIDPANWIVNPLMLNDINADNIPDNWVGPGSATVTRSLDVDAAILGKWATTMRTGGSGSIALDQQMAKGATGDIVRIRGRLKTSGMEAGSGNWMLSALWMDAGSVAQSATYYPYGAGQTIDVDAGVFDFLMPPKPATATKLDLRAIVALGQGSISLAQVCVTVV